jgi:predicted MFS family arabinose efflux permease
MPAWSPLPAFSVAVGLYLGFGSVTGSIAPLITPMSRDLNVSPAQMGAVLGTWQLVYVGTSYLVGLALDRVGLRRTLTAGMLLVVASAGVRGLATDFLTLLAAVALFGVGGPAISIGMPKLVATLFGERERAAALGVGTAAPYLGIMLAFSISNSLLLPLLGSWRYVQFLFGGVVALLVVAWWWVAPRDAPGGRAAAADHHAPPRRARDLLRVRNVAIALLVAPLLFAIGHGVNNWLVRMLEMHGYAATTAGYWAAAANGLTAAGLLLVPRCVPAGRRRVGLAALFACLGASVLGLGMLDGALLPISLLVFGFTRMAPTALLFLLLIDTPGVGSRQMGVVTGAFFAAAEMGGFGGPFVLGLLLEWSGSFLAGSVLLCGMGIALALMTSYLREAGDAGARPEERPA